MDREIDLEKKVGEFFLEMGVFCQRTPKLKTFGRKRNTSSKLLLNGQPDLFIIHNGLYFGIEVKLPKGQQSPDQKEFERRLRAAGANYLICRSMDDASNILAAIEAL